MRNGPERWVFGAENADILESSVHQIAQWARRYAESLSDRDPGIHSQWGDVLNKIEHSAPFEGIGIDAFGALIEEADRSFVDALVHWQSPRFFAYFPCSNSIPSIAGELMSAVLNVNGMLWSTSPACTELEVRMMDWCAELFGLSDAFRFSGSQRGGGCIQGTASEAALAALCAARRRCTKRGVDRGSVCVYASEQAHSSIVKAAMIAGLADHADDRSRVRLIDTDAALRLRPEALERAIKSDLENGLVPAMVVATSGTTSTGAVDPISEIAAVIGRFGDDKAWLHIDAAWAGAACVCPEHRWVLDGHEHADSVCINPHKWLLTNFDCDLFWVKDRDTLVDSMAITPAYLRDDSDQVGREQVVDYRDWHVPLGRRMRALKLWMVLRCFGVQGLREHIDRHITLAKSVERWIRDHPRFELVGTRSLGLVCFRDPRGHEATASLIERVNQRGRVLVTKSEVPFGSGEEASAIARVSVGAPSVDQAAIEVLFEELEACVESE